MAPVDDQEACTSILNLPSEMINTICSTLCHHCSRDNVVDAPYTLIRAAIRDQSALSSLSRTCSRLRGHAQPVLFHAYYSKISLPREFFVFSIFLDQAFGGNHGFSPLLIPYLRRISDEVCRTYLLLRAFHERSDLMSCVRSLSFYQFPWDVQTTLDCHALAFLETSRKLQATLAAQVSRRPWECLREMLGRTQEYLTTTSTSIEQQIDHLYNLQEMVMALCATSLEQLCIERATRSESMMPPGRQEWRAWSYDLPNLRYLAFPGRQDDAERDFNYVDARNFISRAPNLRVLVMPDCANTPLRAAFISRFLTKLSVSDISCRSLSEVLKECPLLQDLEFYRDFTYKENFLSPREDLASVKNTLRRLCYSVLGEKQMVLMNYELNVDSGRVYPSWTCLPALETFETDRLLLYRSRDIEKECSNGMVLASIGHWVPISFNIYLLKNKKLSSIESLHRDKMEETTPEDFLSRLPPSVKTLRIGQICSWPAMYRDAIALAENLPTRFPHLRELRLEVVAEARPPPEQEIRNLARLFSSVGVLFSVKSPRKYQEGLGRGILPLRPGQLDCDISKIPKEEWGANMK